VKPKPIYQPPYARDLSGLSAFGGKVKPHNLCATGSTITSKLCRTGHLVSGTDSCSGGLWVGQNNPGQLGPNCESGDGGSSGCGSGNAP
jgi:hypothetical protein